MTQESDMMSDTDRAPLDGLKRTGDARHRFWRFDPTVSSGTLLQIVVLGVGAIVAYGTYRADQTQIKADIEQVKTTALRDREEMKTTIEGFRTDVKELKVKMDGVGENVAVLKAQSNQPKGQR